MAVFQTLICARGSSEFITNMANKLFGITFSSRASSWERAELLRDPFLGTDFLFPLPAKACETAP